MDALKAEIASKRKAMEDNPPSRPTKYMRRGEIERQREEQEQKARESKKAEEAARQAVASKEKSNNTEVSISLYT
jgi:pre-mRNA-splicing factor 18